MIEIKILIKKKNYTEIKQIYLNRLKSLYTKYPSRGWITISIINKLIFRI